MEKCMLKVKELMKEKRINQKELAQLSGITESSVSRYLKGNRTPRIDIIVNFAKALNVDIEYLMDEDIILTPYESIKFAIARKGNELTDEEKKELVDLLIGNNPNV